MKKTILITGYNGFIANGFLNEYSDKYFMIGTDITAGKSGKPLCAREYSVDICDSDSMRKIFLEHKIDIVIHTAAEKSLIQCENDQENAYRINYQATVDLMELARESGSKMVFISSDQVFDGSHAYSDENAKVSAVNYYGKLKIMAEERLGSYDNSAICRTALVFGNIPEEQEAYFKSVRMQDRLAVQGYIVQQTRYCLENHIPINLPEDEFVSPTHVKLLARQLDAVIERDVRGILHCCGNDRISRFEMGMAIAKKYGLCADYIDGRPGNDPLRPKDVSLDCTKTEQLLGFRFENFREMLDRYMEE